MKQSTILLFAVFTLFSSPLGVIAQQTQTQEVTNVSIHDVVRSIRQFESWKILQFYDKEDASGIRYYRFKLERNDGKLVIIDVDPADPDLKALTQ